jgi:cytoskeletal protein RodZ
MSIINRRWTARTLSVIAMPEEIGKQLSQAREARTLTLEQVAHATHIRLHYLRAIEGGDFSVLSSPAQARGFLRTYANYLGLDAEALLAEVDGRSPTLPSRPALPSAQEPPETEVTPYQAAAIFLEIGRTLRRQREVLGLSLEDVERHTHLRLHYLQALEAGNLAGLPSPVQGRGMLHNYADFLGLDTDPLLLHFAEGLQARLAARRASRPVTRPAKSRRLAGWLASLRDLISIDFIIGGLVMGFLAGFVVWGVIRISDLRSQASELAPTQTAPSIADVLLLSPTPSLAAGQLTGVAGTAGTPAPSLDTTLEAGGPLSTVELGGTREATHDVTPPVTQPVVSNAPLQVYVVVRQRAWMRVLVDGEVAFQGRVAPGSAYPFPADQRVELLTGNGAALQVFFNQLDLGVLGAFGEVVLRVFTIQGVQTPTATLTPTARPVTPTPTSQGTPTTLP